MSAGNTQWCGIEGPFTALVVGARGGVGAAFAEHLASSEAIHQVWVTSRDSTWVKARSVHTKIKRLELDLVDEESLARCAQELRRAGENSNAPLRFVINASGLLHEGDLQPERTWRHLNLETMRRVFEVNTFGVGLLMKHMIPLLPRRERSLFATLSARVGSIGDNRLGGWYSYRASKAAQNMLVKTAAIEAMRTHPHLTLVALHPGTVRSDLSAPFTQRLSDQHEVFLPEVSCRHLCTVLNQLQPQDTGKHFAWDGALIPE